MARFHLQDFKKQASFFLREKLNGARLALTDVSRIQLLTEEATNEDPWGPETRTMAKLADAAFEFEEYERIVQVIHQRLDGGKKLPWRQLHKTLVVLEYLLTHGPKSLGKEFRSDLQWFEELSQFDLTDEQGIDRGLMIRKEADRVLELLNNPDFRNEERSRARKISGGIQGFGSNRPHEVQSPDVVQSIEYESHLSDSKSPFSSSNELSQQPRNAGAGAGAQLEPKQVLYEKCPSSTFQLKQDSSGAVINECNRPAMLPPSEGKSMIRSYRKSLSSPGYFRERLPASGWRPCHADGVIESEEEVTCLLDAVPEQDNPFREDAQKAEPISDVLVEIDGTDSSAPRNEDGLALLESIDTFALADICKSSLEHSMKSFPVLLQPALPKLRMKFQHDWQHARLIDCDVKFGKAA